MSNDRPSDDSQASEGRKRRGLDGRMIGGRYRVTRTVAAGANTLIADAHDTELDRVVTIKLVRPELSESDEFRRSFRKQMDLMSQISHPNIAAVYDWGEERIGKRTTVYAVVEYLSGGSLRDLFDRGRNLTPSQALMVGLEACRGLDFAHRKGFVHTELTPSKLVFGDDRRLRIVDFGLARTLGEEQWRDPSRVATHVARYASPEQAQGKQLDGKTDVYSLALILVEAVTGATPFVGDSTVSTLSARIGKLMPVSADLGSLASVLERAGRPEPNDRATASQFGRALVRAAERMPRPTPIPILSPGLFVDDPAAMRRPDDPTGGISRPPAAPEPAIVPPSAASPTDSTTEITGPPRATPAGDVARRPAAAVTGPVPAISSLDVPAPATDTAPATVPSASPAPAADPTDTVATAGVDVHDELAALVERTPQKPAPPGERAAVTAERGATTAPSGRKGRRAERKAAKAEAKEAKAARKAARSGAAVPASVTAVTEGDLAALMPASRRRRRWVPAALMLLVLGALAGIGYLAWVLLQTPKHEIPAVVGLPQDEALALVDDFKWDIELDEGRSDEHPEPGLVMSVTPPVGEDLSEGSPLLLVISQGPEYRQVPDLAGMPLDAATAEIERLRLVAGEPTRQFSETVPAGAVISATVDGVAVGDNVLPGATVNLVVSDGPQQRRVPQLRGLTVEEATQLLGDLGLEIVVEEPVFDDDIPAGEIAVQTPAADTTIDRGAAITVSPSKGPDLVTMPDLSGMTLAQIGQALDDAGLQLGPLVGVRSGVFYQAYLDGELVQAGDQVKRGSQISVLIFPPS